IAISGNTINTGGNTCTITGVPQDAGGQGTIDGVTIDHNVLNGVVARISVEGGNSASAAITKHVNITNNIVQSFWTAALIDITGGTYGSVNTVSVTGNTLTGPNIGQNQILSDSHTVNSTIQNNINL
ncbi:MAG TPA: hypothetical protein VLT58_17920, partial [Polyangia bacterium]|nr:hypothetical protein [Polyangia bacterium]